MDTASGGCFITKFLSMTSSAQKQTQNEDPQEYLCSYTERGVCIKGPALNDGWPGLLYTNARRWKGTRVIFSRVHWCGALLPCYCQEPALHDTHQKMGTGGDPLATPDPSYNTSRGREAFSCTPQECPGISPVLPHHFKEWNMLHRACCFCSPRTALLGQHGQQICPSLLPSGPPPEAALPCCNTREG